MGESRDLLAAEEALPIAGRPDRVGPEQAEELLGKFVPGGVLDRADHVLDRVEVGLRCVLCSVHVLIGFPEPGFGSSGGRPLSDGPGSGGG